MYGWIRTFIKGGAVRRKVFDGVGEVIGEGLEVGQEGICMVTITEVIYKVAVGVWRIRAGLQGRYLNLCYLDLCKFVYWW